MVSFNIIANHIYMYKHESLQKPLEFWISHRENFENILRVKFDPSTVV